MPGVKAVKKMLLASYEMEINFSGHFILMTVLIIVLFKPTLIKTKGLASNLFPKNPLKTLYLFVSKDLGLKYFV